MSETLDARNVLAAARLLRSQVDLDRTTPYWTDRLDQLDGVTSWLDSLIDWADDGTPVGSEVREEWGVRYENGVVVGPVSEASARGSADNTGFIDTFTLVRRTVTTTAWQVAE